MKVVMQPDQFAREIVPDRLCADPKKNTSDQGVRAYRARENEKWIQCQRRKSVADGVATVAVGMVELRQL